MLKLATRRRVRTGLIGGYGTVAYLAARIALPHVGLLLQIGYAACSRAAPLAAAGPQITWLQPIPDALVSPVPGDPAEVAVSRESLRLALIASLQYLPPRQRAVLILRQVLGFPAAEAARILGTTTPPLRVRCSALVLGSRT
jgi:Sigma-70, region 4